MNMPIPAAKPDAVARMKQQQLYEKEHHQFALVHKPVEMFKSTPDYSAAAHVGAPNLAPPDEIVSATDVLSPTSGAGQFNIRNAGPSTGGAADGGAAGTVDTESVETNDTADSTSTPPAQATSAPTGAAVADSNGANAADAAATAPA